MNTVLIIIIFWQTIFGPDADYQLVAGETPVELLPEDNTQPSQKPKSLGLFLTTHKYLLNSTESIPPIVLLLNVTIVYIPFCINIILVLFFKFLLYL